MEVHHHSHSERKKWTHYLWEFLMLFLAVFCGFLAENVREHKIEKDRENQYIKSLLEDLQKDSSSLAYSMVVGPRIVRYGDSLTNELSKRPLQRKEKRLYHFFSLVSEGVVFKYYDRTVSQLRNSGGFRLLSKINVSNALIDYDVAMREGVNYSGSVECWNFITPAVQKAASIFDIGLLMKVHKDARTFMNNTDSLPFPTSLQLMTYDDKVIKEYSNLQHYADLTDQTKLYYTIAAFQRNRQLDSLIKKEYHLK